jgi:hypothetical protein
MTLNYTVDGWLLTFLYVLEPFWFADINEPLSGECETKPNTVFQGFDGTVLQASTSIDDNQAQLGQCESSIW